MGAPGRRPSLCRPHCHNAARFGHDVQGGVHAIGHEAANIVGTLLPQDGAIKRSDGEMVLNPPPDTNIKPGDVLITVGTEKTLTGLENMLNPSPAGF